jgi:hypothetical protein
LTFNPFCSKDFMKFFSAIAYSEKMISGEACTWSSQTMERALPTCIADKGRAWADRRQRGKNRFRKCLQLTATVFAVTTGRPDTLYAQQAPLPPDSQCQAMNNALNDAVLRLENDLSLVNNDFRACRVNLGRTEQSLLPLTERLERCDQADAAAQGLLNKARDSVRSCEAAQSLQEKAWNEERRKLTAELSDLKARVTVQTAAPNRDQLVESLSNQVDDLRAQLDDAQRALTDATERLEQVIETPPQPVQAEPIDARLAKAAVERKELEDLVATLFKQNRELDSELKRNRLEASQKSPGGGITQCPPQTSTDAALQGSLSQCRADLTKEAGRVTALSAEREQLIIERDALRASRPEANRVTPVEKPLEPTTLPASATSISTPTPSPPLPPSIASSSPAASVDCIIKGHNYSLYGVPAGTYRLSDIGLGDIPSAGVSGSIKISQPLCLMARGVTVAEFDAFVVAQPTGEQKRLNLSSLQKELRSSLDPSAPALGLPLDVAEAYAAWLSKSTGRRFTLPERHEWLAALAVWSGARKTDALARAGAHDLLSGRFDWSATACGQSGGKSKRVLIGNVEGGPPAGGVQSLCRDVELPPNRTMLRLKLAP